MDKSQQMIMVVSRSTLFGQQTFQGFAPAEGTEYYQRINDTYEYRRRGEVETDPSVKQPIGYCVICHRPSGRVFAYQRAQKSDAYKETRLQGMWSWGIGGHIDKGDEANQDPIRDSMAREIREEINIGEYETPQVLGYINDDETPVGQVHFGVLFVVLTEDEAVSPADAEIAWGGFKTIKELETIVEDPDARVETWSSIALPALKDHLNRSGL